MPVQSTGALLAGICLLKGKRFPALIGIFVPVVALVGALRLGRPNSRWGRRLYTDPKRERSRRHYSALGQASGPLPAKASR